MVDAEIRKRLREVSAAASKGPWTHQRQWCPDGEYWAHFVHTGEHVPLAWNGSAIDTAEFDEHDAAFVAEANPTMVIALLDDLEALEQKVMDLTRELETARVNWEVWQRAARFQGSLTGILEKVYSRAERDLAAQVAKLKKELEDLKRARKRKKEEPDG